MARDILRVDGIPAETKAQLQASARRLYGTANASLLVRTLIADHLAKNGVPIADQARSAEGAGTVRVELRLPHAAVSQLDAIAEARLSARNYYLSSLILARLGEHHLQGDEIEVLRRSNYEMARVGNNLNQIAKAFNTLVRSGDGKMPEIGKKMSSLRTEIRTHVSKVLKVLDAGTKLWDVQGKGRGQRDQARAAKRFKATR